MTEHLFFFNNIYFPGEQDYSLKQSSQKSLVLTKFNCPVNELHFKECR